MTKSKTARNTTVVNKRRESYDIYIGRGSRWGNPYPIDRIHDRTTVVAMFERRLRRWPETMLNELHTLRGKRLGCFCAPQLCHGEVLAYYADADIGKHDGLPEPKFQN